MASPDQYQRRKAAGVCVICGVRPPASGVKCEACAERAARLAKARSAAARAAGLCIACAASEAAPGRSGRCTTCADKLSACMARYRAARRAGAHAHATPPGGRHACRGGS